MKTEKQGKREKQLTKDTARAFAHTCRGMVALTNHLLCTTQEYVCPGHFTSDPLEKMFGKLQQGSGGTYFVNGQQFLQKVTIRKTKLCLDLRVNIEEMEGICIATHLKHIIKWLSSDKKYLEHHLDPLCPLLTTSFPW